MKKIRFAIDSQYAASVIPAKNGMPKWYRDSKLHYPKSNPRTTYKGCVPFMDAMLNGYLLTLPVDLNVMVKDDGVWIEWAKAGKPEPIEARALESIHGLPIPHGYVKQAFAFYSPIALQLPKGYSALVTHPLNRFDLPFQVTSGIVDSDKVPLSFGKMPFFVKEGFEGIIPAGTPYAQVIPIKREDYKAVNDQALEAESNRVLVQSQSRFSGWYKKNVHVVKTYLGFDDQAPRK